MPPSFQERYAAAMTARSQTYGERSYRCMCCRDQAIIPADIVRRYVVSDYDTVFVGEVAYLCQYTRCEANNAIADTEEGRRQVARYAEYATSGDIDSARCREIHERELARLQEAIAHPTTIDIAAAVASNAIVRSMPTAEPRRIPHEKVVAFEEWMDQQSGVDLGVSEVEPLTEMKGFRVGDTVRVAIDHFDKAQQREITRNQEVPIGAVGVIDSFLEDDMLKKSGISRPLAAVRLESGALELLGLSYLRSEVAA